MRLFEILFIAAAVICIFFLWRKNRSASLVRVGSLLVLVILLSHIFVEGTRWQLYPAYLTSVVVLLWGLLLPDRGRNLFGRIVNVIALMLTAFSLALAMVFPVFDLPQPGGPYAVGTMLMHFVDQGRPEIFSEEATDVRELMVRAWYPAKDVNNAERAVYADDAKITGRQFSLFTGLPTFIFDHLELVETHSYWNVKPQALPDGLPILIFSHGYGVGMFTQNTVLMQELASRGYAVFSISHPYETLATIFPDGRIIPMEHDRVASLFGEESDSTYQAFLAASELAEKERYFRAMLKKSRVRDESLRVWTADTRFVLNQLDTLNRSSNGIWSNRLNLDAAGVLGMSFGGATAGQSCLLDPRFKAGVNMDGWQVGDLINGDLQQPFLFMQSEQLQGRNDPVVERLTGSVHLLTVPETYHFNFSDFSIQSPFFKWIGFLGDIDGERMVRIMNGFVVGFFDKYLRGDERIWLESLRRFPRVEHESRHSPDITTPSVTDGDAR